MRVIEGDRVPIKAWVDGVELEEPAIVQLKNLAALPFIHKHLAVMPDVHSGYGSTVGSVIPTDGAIIPAAVGVDIGCGMMAVRTEFRAIDLPDSLGELRTLLEAAIPHGRTNDGGPGDRGAWGEITDDAANFDNLWRSLDIIVDKHPKLERASQRAPHHMGTLGTGNHFVEICLDEEDRVWIMLHSGSRGIGNSIGTYFINRAKERMQRHFIHLPDRDLAYIPEGEVDFEDYIRAMTWAQGFAALNRELMMQEAKHALAIFMKRPAVVTDIAVNCHHNYTNREHHFGKKVWVTRKGAVSAHKGQLGIIPGSMGARSFIVEGKGHHDSFCSCSHGAGRRMSRTEAKRRFTLEDHRAAVLGVECRVDEDVIDETPAAYKSIDAVMAAQADLVAVKHILRQIVCVKG